MSGLKDLPNRGKLAVCAILAIITISLIVVAIVSNQSGNDTIKVGGSSFQQDAHSFPDYKTSSGSRLTILNPEGLKPHMSEDAIANLETSMKQKLYDQTLKIASVGSVVGKIQTEDAQIVFSIKTDVSDVTYRITASYDGTVKELADN
ncbi:MAG: hypothetical protein ABIQ89_01630 [Candidatus Saccharimonadales bacterium]